MKLYRNAIILVIVLGLMVGAYFILNNKKSTDETDPATTTETTTEKIIDVASDKAQDITIEAKDNKIVFGKKDKEWVLVQPADLKADNSIVAGLASEIISLNADKVIEEKAEDLSKYGLNSPNATVTVKLSDGSSKVLELGNKTPLEDGYYVKLKENNKIYTIGSYTGERLIDVKNSIRVTTLFEGKAEDVRGVGMEKAGKVVFYGEKSGTEWRMTAPIEGILNITNVGPMIDSAINSKISDFIEENPSDLDKYGLKNPAYTFELDINNAGKTKILLGKKEKESSNYYAKLDGKNEVFTVDAASFNFLDKPLKEILDPFAYIANINDVSKIVVEMDGQTTTSEIQTDKEDKDKDKFTVNGKDATFKDDQGNQPFRKYYQAIIGVTFSEIEIGAIPSEKPEITITYTLKNDPGTMRVDFIPKDDNSYYVMRNGKYANIVVSKKKFEGPDSIRETQKALIEAMAKK